MKFSHRFITICFNNLIEIFCCDICFGESSAVSGCAFSAGIAGLLTAGFADRFERKKLLLFFYIGFIAGTIFCALANSFHTLLVERIMGLFSGVICSISLAIVANLFDIYQYGSVMGFVQMGLGASQVLGIPIWLYLANPSEWRTPFYLVIGMSTLIAVLIIAKLKPVSGERRVPRSPLTKRRVKKKLRRWLLSHRLSVYRRIYDNILQ